MLSRRLANLWKMQKVAGPGASVRHCGRHGTRLGFRIWTPTTFGDLPREGDPLRSCLMSAHRIGLIGLSALVLTATVRWRWRSRTRS
jgi:hypothetical protein